MKINLKINPSIGLRFVEIMNIFFMIILTSSVYWKNFSIVRLAGIIFLWILFLFIPVLIFKKHSQFFDTLSEKLESISATISENKKFIFNLIIYIIAAFLLPCFFCFILAKIKNNSFNNILYLFGVFCLLSLLALFLFIKSKNGRPEHLFLAILLISGITFILMSPNQVGISWDDQIHYDRVESITDLIDGYGLKTDEELTKNFIQVTGITGHMYGYSQADRAKYNNEWNSLYRNPKFGIINQSFGIWSIAYIPYVVGALIGRGLFLPFTWVFRLSRIFNLLFYGLLIYKAAKKLKNGKTAVLVIGLLPTVVFMASSFSYDPWVIGWTLYGFCYFLSFLQDRSRKMSKTDAVKIIGAYILGCLPKAIYFVMMIPLLFLPSSSFRSKKDHVMYLTGIICSGIFLVSTFIIPLFLKGAGTGDVRGGSEVNAAGQITFILQEPFSYGKILFNFLLDYLNISNAGQYINNFAYIGMGKLSGLSICIVFGTILLDKNGIQDKTIKIIISTVLAFIITIILIATSLYISYTPVRFNTINGCQFRYILPALFPFLYIVTPARISNHIDGKLFCTVPFTILSILFVCNTTGVMLMLY